jgi:probable HAF family extracellular repeat protein
MHRPLHLLVVLALSLTMFVPARAQDEAGPPVFAVLDLGRLDGADRIACPDAPLIGGINRLGPATIAAGEVVDSTGLLVAALFTQEGIVNLPSGAAGGVARDLNSRGEVVGAIFTQAPIETCDSASKPLPARWKADRTLEVLRLPNGATEGMAEGINDDGVVVGWVVANEREALVRWWPNGRIDVLPSLVPTGAESVSSIGYDVDSRGRVAGTMIWVTGGTVRSQAFIWDQGAPVLLGSLTGGNSFAYAINASGQVAGSADLRREETERAFVWSNGVIVDLWWLPDTIASRAHDLNNLGHVVGVSSTDSGFERATLWLDGETYNLNDLIDPTSGWQLQSATSIDDAGVIVGYGDFDGSLHAYMLIPGVG